MTPFSLPDILSRIADLVGAKTDSALADALGVTRQTFATWKRRGKIPFEEICEFAQQRDISLDFLLLGKKETKARIDIDLFKGIRRTLRDTLSEARQFLDDDDIDNYALDFYNEAISIADPLLRMRMITRSIVLVSREKFKELRYHLEWHVQNFEKLVPERSQFPELKSVEDAQKKLDEIRKRIEEFDAFLRSPSARSIDDIRKEFATTKPEATHAETSTNRKMAENHGPAVTGRDTATKGGRKKKKK